MDDRPLALLEDRLAHGRRGAMALCDGYVYVTEWGVVEADQALDGAIAV
jgi:hypothetical protein